jgi:hypothetical protein
MPPPPLSSRGRSHSERLPRGPLSAIFSMHPLCGRACASTGGGHVICDAGTECGCGGVCVATRDSGQCSILVMTRGLPSHTVSVSTCTCTCSWTGVGVLTDFLCDSGARLNSIGSVRYFCTLYFARFPKAIGRVRARPHLLGHRLLGGLLGCDLLRRRLLGCHLRARAWAFLTSLRRP